MERVRVCPDIFAIQARLHQRADCALRARIVPRTRSLEVRALPGFTALRGLRMRLEWVPVLLGTIAKQELIKSSAHRAGIATPARRASETAESVRLDFTVLRGRRRASALVLVCAAPIVPRAAL